ncbi:MAG: PrsW family intramembrane metalloprotease [Myxococcales bacterium]|nr:PrsW family intramembrane metalloprotease [Myxococcales bacterium]
MPRILLVVLVGAVPLAFALLLWRRVNRLAHVPRRRTLMMVVGGVAAGLTAGWVERLILAFSELSFDATKVGTVGALLATFLLAAPLEEGLKVLVVWPLFGMRALSSPRLGLTYAACAGAGFATGETIGIGWVEAPTSVLAVRLLVGMAAHPFLAGLWGYSLGNQRLTRGRRFVVAWFAAVLLHGLYDHIVFGRGPGLLVLAIPMFLCMVLVAGLAIRDVAPSPDSRGSALLSSIPEPPSLGSMSRALTRRDRPLMLHWIAIGALVTLGVVLVALAGAVYVGHVVGVDFALADEADVRSSGPLVLLGAATLAGFPLAGYLVARASSAHSVLEPAMGAGVAIITAVLLVSLAAPVTAVFGLAVAPLAFALACGGAWFGLVR